MKKLIFYIVLILPFLSFAQFHHGLELGIHTNSADFIIGESQDPESKIGFSIGYLAEHDLSDNLYVRFGVNFNKRELEATNVRGINTTKEKWGLDVVEIPINLGYYVNWNNRNLQFFVDAGFNIGYNSRAIVENNDETIRLDIGGEGDIKKISTGVNGGFGLLIKHRFKVRFNYYHGLASIVTTDNDIWKNKIVGISINYFLKERPIVY